jgi:hypothetical protein
MYLWERAMCMALCHDDAKRRENGIEEDSDNVNVWTRYLMYVCTVPPPEHIRRRVFALITSSMPFSPATSPRLAKSIAWCGTI